MCAPEDLAKSDGMSGERFCEGLERDFLDLKIIAAIYAV
jgi:hypothetical protein